MASYYYLASSLPMLTAGGDMPMSYAEFLRCWNPSACLLRKGRCLRNGQHPTAR